MYNYIQYEKRGYFTHEKILLPLLALILMLAACGNGSNDKSSKENSEKTTYKQDSGEKVEIPKT